MSYDSGVVRTLSGGMRGVVRTLRGGMRGVVRTLSGGMRGHFGWKKVYTRSFQCGD
jgi:hypothetical protein